MRTLVAVDDTAGARSALRMASELAARIPHTGDVEVSDELSSITIWRPSETIGPDGVGLILDLDYPEVAEGLLEELDHDAGVSSEHLVRTGAVADSILGVGDEGDYEIIVVGTRAHSAVRQALTGSVSQRVVAEAVRPTVVVPPDWDPAAHVGEGTVIAHDGSDGAEAAVRWAIRWAERPLHIVHVIPPADPETTLAAVAGSSVVLGARSAGHASLWGSLTARLAAEPTRPIVVVPPGWPDPASSGGT